MSVTPEADEVINWIRQKSQAIDRARQGITPPPQPPLANQGGHDDNGGMEARIAKLEAAVEHIQRDITDIKSIVRGHDTKFDSMRDCQERDFRLLFGAIIAATLGLAGLMAKGFHWF